MRVATVLVKEDGVEKAVSLNEFEADQSEQGEKKFKRATQPVDDAIAFAVERVPASSGQHAQIQAAVAYARVDADRNGGIVAAPLTSQADDDASVLEVVVDGTNLASGLAEVVKVPSELQADIDAQNAQIAESKQNIGKDVKAGKK